VWDSDVSSMDLLAMPIEGERLHQRGVRCMCFSKDGRHLISVGAEHEHMVAVVDWKSGQVVCLEKGDVNPIVAVRCNPHDGCFVTVGKHHVKFWSIKVGIPLFCTVPIVSWSINIGIPLFLGLRIRTFSLTSAAMDD